MRYTWILCLMWAAASAISAPASMEVKLQIRNGTLQVRADGKTHTLEIGDRPGAARLEQAALIRGAREGNNRYLVMEISGPSRYPMNDKKCGAGWERDLVWIHADPTWAVRQLQVVRVESCWKSILSHMIRDGEEKPWVIEQNLLLAKNDEFGAGTTNKLICDLLNIQDGFHVMASRPMNGTSECRETGVSTTAPQVRRPEFPDDLLTPDERAEHRELLREPAYGDVTESFQDAFCDFVELAYGEDYCTRYQSLVRQETELVAWGRAHRARSDDAGSTVSRAAYEHADRELNEVYSRLADQLSGPQKLRLLLSQRRWMRYRDRCTRLMESLRGAKPDYLVPARLTGIQRDRLKELLSRSVRTAPPNAVPPVPAGNDTSSRKPAR